MYKSIRSSKPYFASYNLKPGTNKLTASVATYKAAPSQFAIDDAQHMFIVYDDETNEVLYSQVVSKSLPATSFEIDLSNVNSIRFECPVDTGELGVVDGERGIIIVNSEFLID